MLGLLGGSHCLAMCGGLSAALGMGSDAGRRWLYLWCFQLGRVTSYTLLGAAFGGLFAIGTEALPAGLPVLRIVSGLLLIAMGLYVSSWWNGLLWLERRGQWLWRHLQPATQRLLPVRRLDQALLLGASWGLLPCGLIYTALAWAAASANAASATLLMLCFGLGTLPVMLATGAAGERLGSLLRLPSLRNIAAVILMGFGCLTLYGVWQHRGGGDSGDHRHHHRAAMTAPNGAA